MSENSSPRTRRTPALRRPEYWEYHKMSPEDKSLWTAFEMAKPRMCGQAAKKTMEAIEKHRRYGGYAYPSIHPFYVKIKGKGQIYDPDCYYYPYLLVLQALWPGSEHVEAIAKAFAKYWGVPNLWRGPSFYPMLNDRDLEMKLFMGEKPRETEERQDESSMGNGGDNGEEEEKVKQEDAGEEQPQEDEQEEELEQEQEQQLEGEQSEGDEEQDEQQDEGDEGTIPDIDAITEIDELDELEKKFEKREKELTVRVHETEELIRKVQERKRDHFKKKSRASKKAAERLQKQVDEKRRTSEYWATMEREYNEKLQLSSATSSAISPPPEQGAERPAKRQRVAESEE